MKRLLLLIGLSSSVAFGQNTITVTKAEYQQLKASGLIDQNASYNFSDLAFPSNIKYAGTMEKNGVCDCMVPLDSTFLLAMQPNDDASSDLINLPFTFDFYGNQYNSLYINNNGNISFVSPYSTFTPNPFPDSSYNMIAPFWADVDTRGTFDSLGLSTGDGGSVWYKITPTALIVNWNQVGYYNYHTDLVSTFQLIISNGSDSLVSAGGNASFCYQDMQWATGDATAGGGFGGLPSTVGVNVGNGTDFFQVGQFDQSGTAFDGPFNMNDGVDFLDGQEIYFNVAGMSTTNTPPLLISSTICDTIDVYTGDTLQKSGNSMDFAFGIMTPETNQTIVTTYNTNAPIGTFSYTTNNIGNQFYNVVNATFNAAGVSPGIYTVDFTATDDGFPVGITTQRFTFNVMYSATAGLDENSMNEFSIFPNPTNDKFNISLKAGNSNARLILQDVTGKIMLDQAIQNNQQIDLSNYTNGIYFATIQSNNTVIGVQRVVKK
jgi:hypothetical protein